jgi:uncharacterized Fe-S cluster protein YjdI
MVNLKSPLLLPRHDADGKPYVSFSQVKSWNSSKSFNLGVEGKLEYMLSYFFGEDFGDMGWAQFGQEVEDYICFRKFKEKFTAKERKVLDSIVPLGLFQQEVKIDFGDFYLLGYIDDATPDLTKLRDYKTCSLNSSKQYYKEDYYQLDIYAMWVLQETGKVPKELEVCMIERAGNCFRGGGRNVLSVKDEVWYHPRETSVERMEYLRHYIRATAMDISKHYKAFLTLTQ